ncbi:MAG: hypothetical protein JWO06_2048 [Bacteroidota bacterium]|nr:hypothetical protein [Bacteroidota bacterium]
MADIPRPDDIEDLVKSKMCWAEYVCGNLKLTFSGNSFNPEAWWLTGMITLQHL